MNMKQKWMAVAGAAAVAGAVLVSGMAMASTDGTAAASTPAASAPAAGARQGHQKGPLSPDQLKAQLDQQVKDGKLTQGQEDVMLQLDTLRQGAMTKLQADEKAIIDQAVQSGKLTQDQATQLQQHDHGFGGPGGGHGGPGDDRGGRGDHGGPGFGRGHGMDPNMTADQLKAKLDQDVKDGKLTQEKADQMLKDFTQHQADHAAQQNQAPANP